MAEEALEKVKSEMGIVLSGNDANLEGLRTTMDKLVAEVKAAEATLAAQKDVLETKKGHLDEMTTAENASLETLADKEKVKAAGDAKVASLEADKAALESAFQVHFQVPMEANEGPHFKELEPFLQTMDIEKSLFSTLPGTCAKTKEKRGSFDDVILEQLEKALTGSISTLAESIAAESLAVTGSVEALQEVQTDCSAKQDAREHAAAEFEVAQTEQSGAEEALVKANEAVTELCPQLEQAAAQSELTKSKLVAFETGPLEGFMTFKTRTAAPTEAATAGA